MHTRSPGFRSLKAHRGREPPLLLPEWRCLEEEDPELLSPSAQLLLIPGLLRAQREGLSPAPGWRSWEAEAGQPLCRGTVPKALAGSAPQDLHPEEDGGVACALQGRLSPPEPAPRPASDASHSPGAVLCQPPTSLARRGLVPSGATSSPLVTSHLGSRSSEGPLPRGFTGLFAHIPSHAVHD